MLTTHCIQVISAKPDVCRGYVDLSASLAAALVPALGYEAAIVRCQAIGRAT